jgi:hypothetical protein
MDMDWDTWQEVMGITTGSFEGRIRTLPTTLRVEFGWAPRSWSLVRVIDGAKYEQLKIEYRDKVRWEGK